MRVFAPDGAELLSPLRGDIHSKPRLFIDDRPDLRAIGRNGDLACLLKILTSAIPFSGHIIDDPLIFVSAVLDHRIADAETDRLAEVEGFFSVFSIICWRAI